MSSLLPALVACMLGGELAKLPTNEVAIDKASVVQRSKEFFGTRCTIAIWGAPKGEARTQTFQAAFDAFERVERLTNPVKPGAPLARINEAAGREAVSAPEELCAMLRAALDGARRTNGLFDPTWAAVSDLWSFDQTDGHAPPAADALKKACTLVSWKNVQLKALPKPTPEAACTVKLKTAGMKLALGGLVKGWGIDQAVKELRSRGLKDFFVQAGGDLILSGKNGDDPWKVGIRDPRGGPDQSFARGELTDTAFSTSADYDRFFMKDGVRYHDIIDPHTCAPASASVSATIDAKNATEAELLTKAAFVLGGDKGVALAEKLGAHAVIVDASGNVHASKELKERLQVWAPSGFGHDAGTP